MDWTGAKCGSIPDMDLFFPEREGRANGKEAKYFCKGLDYYGNPIENPCPIMGKCFYYATWVLKTDFGVWGASSPLDRKRHRALVHKSLLELEKQMKELLPDGGEHPNACANPAL